MPDDARAAVFLSYAREDAETVRQLTEALRAQGVQVWFDQSELRGADAWDQKIRRQIKECALFVPVVSANTQQRIEGYFRLEWKLAAERTHLRAEGSAFIAPVVVDDTPENDAAVPAEFLKVQWTRLPGGRGTPEFVALVKQLLAGPRTAAPWGTSMPLSSSRLPPASVPAPRRAPVWIWVVAAVVVAAIVGAVMVRPRGTQAVAETKMLGAKSLAVLPFENQSTEKDVEFFTYGMHDEVITALSKIHDLTVIARTSVMAYQETTGRNLKAIAAELGVATILEGSVQRAGSQIKVNVKLIDARTDQHVLWSDVYTEDLADAFKVQSKLAAAITSALKAAFSPEEKALLARRPTQNQEAYDLYLRGRALNETISNQETLESLDRVAALYEQATAKDPAFTLAWVQLVNVHGQQYWYANRDPSPARRARVKAALDAARQSAPDAPETRFALGTYDFYVENDWARALAEFREAEAGMPNDAELKYLIGHAQKRLGQWNESLASTDLAIALNPLNATYPASQGNNLRELRRYSELRYLAARGLELFPNNASLLAHRTQAEFELGGDRMTWLRRREEDPPFAFDTFGLNKAYGIARDRGDFVAADKVLADPRLTYVRGPNTSVSEPVALHRGYTAFLRGDKNAARAYAEEAMASYRATTWTPGQEPWVKNGMALAQALAGRTDEAVQMAREALAQQVARDPFNAPTQRYELARLYLLLDRRDDALAELRVLMTGPSRFGPEEIRASAMWAPVKDDPRFEQYLRLAKRL